MPGEQSAFGRANRTERKTRLTTSRTNKQARFTLQRNGLFYLHLVCVNYTGCPDGIVILEHLGKFRDYIASGSPTQKRRWLPNLYNETKKSLYDSKRDFENKLPESQKTSIDAILRRFWLSRYRQTKNTRSLFQFWRNIRHLPLLHGGNT